ncbi:MAG: Substrate-specific component BioY of biotin ECF transporter, partial [uncultured Corynebacteriales bacterium]
GDRDADARPPARAGRRDPGGPGARRRPGDRGRAVHRAARAGLDPGRRLAGADHRADAGRGAHRRRAGAVPGAGRAGALPAARHDRPAVLLGRGRRCRRGVRRDRRLPGRLPAGGVPDRAGGPAGAGPAVQPGVAAVRPGPAGDLRRRGAVAGRVGRPVGGPGDRRRLHAVHRRRHRQGRAGRRAAARCVAGGAEARPAGV